MTKTVTTKEASMSYKPDNYAQLTPCLAVRNGAKAVDFYQKAFGFKILDDVVKDEKGDVQYATLKLRDSTIMIFPEGAFGFVTKAPVTLGVPSPISLYIYIPDVDNFYTQAVDAGAKTILEPHDAFWGDRFCKVMDLDGHEWGFATYNEQAHAQHKQEKK
jgi:uncharacterized glyoxalase superfamily protein PhnB